MKGLEPPRLSASDPKSDAATNYATSAESLGGAKIQFFFKQYTFFCNKICELKKNYLLHLLQLIFTLMTVFYRLIFFVLIFLNSLVLSSQSLVGVQSNYAGSRSLSMNPALMNTSYLYSDFYVANLSLSAFNDYVYINNELYNISNINIEQIGEQIGMFDNEKPKNLYQSLDLNVLGFMYSIDARQSVGFSTNARVYTNATDVPYDIIDIIRNGLKNKDKKDYNGSYTSSDVSISTMEWMEFAFAYSRKIYDKYHNRIDAGVSIKYLLGYSAAVGNINELNYVISEDTVVTVNKFDADMAYSLPIKYDEPLSSHDFIDKSLVRGHGVAFDIGLTYTHKKFVEVNKKRIFASCMLPKLDYKWRLGLSLVDLGFINFNDNAIDNSFDNVDPVVFDKTVFDHLERFGDMIKYMSAIYYDGDTLASVVNDKFKVGLPTTLRFQFDYNLYKHFYINTTIIQPIKIFKYSVVAASQLMVEPRYESDNFDFSLPLTLSDYRHLSLGASMRMGFFTIGTQNLSSYLGLGDIKGMDFYVSIKFNFIRGNCAEDRYDACWSADYGNKKYRR